MTMWSAYFKKGFIEILTGMVCAALTVTTCFAQSQEQRAVQAATEESVKKFLQNYTKTPYLPEDKVTRYFDALVDLNGDGKEVIVYLTGSAMVWQWRLHRIDSGARKIFLQG